MNLANKSCIHTAKHFDRPKIDCTSLRRTYIYPYGGSCLRGTCSAFQSSNKNYGSSFKIHIKILVNLGFASKTQLSVWVHPPRPKILGPLTRHMMFPACFQFTWVVPELCGTNHYIPTSPNFHKHGIYLPKTPSLSVTLYQHSLL